MTIVSKTACIFLLLSGPLFAQHFDFGFDFGVKGGVPLSDVLQTAGVISAPDTFLKRSSDFLIGPVAELRIPFGFALEVDGLYRGTEYNFTTNDITTTLNAHAWEIPYLAKFRFPIPLLKPFVSAGGAYRSFTDLPNNVTATHNAVVIGAGVELRIRKLRVSAEGRWLRWGSTSTSPVRLAQDQGELLFGIVF